MGALAADASVGRVAAGQRLLKSAEQVRLIYSPQDRSRGFRDLALALLDHDLPRAAAAMARRCLVNDRLFVLASILRWEPSTRKHRFSPLLLPDE